MLQQATHHQCFNGPTTTRMQVARSTRAEPEFLLKFVGIESDQKNCNELQSKVLKKFKNHCLTILMYCTTDSEANSAGKQKSFLISLIDGFAITLVF